MTITRRRLIQTAPLRHWQRPYEPAADFVEVLCFLIVRMDAF